jgi:hypothetical protein
MAALAVTANRQALELLMSLAVPVPVPASGGPQAGPRSQVRTSAAWAWLATCTRWPLAALLAVQAVPSGRWLWAVVLLAPDEQARIHTKTSLLEHVDSGAWFECAVALAVLPFIPTAIREYSWPGAATLMTSMHDALPAHPGPILSDDGGDRLHFYLSRQVVGVPVDGTFYISYSRPGDAQPQTSLAGYAAAIRSAYFSVILLEFVDNLYVDGRIERDVSLSGRYRLIDSIPHAAPGGPRDCLIWVRKGQE